MPDIYTTVSYDDVIIVIDAGTQGPPGRDGVGSGGGGGGSVFVLDVTPTSSGVVGMKTGPATIPANKVVDTCVSDTKFVRVHVGIEGGGDNYSPEVTIHGQPASLTESSTVRWFVGYADIEIGDGTTRVEVSANTGSKASVDIILAGAGPGVLSCMFGSLPGAQTALKAGDTIPFSLTVEASATSLTLLAQGASNVSRTFPVIGGSVTGVLAVGSALSDAGFVFKATNELGTDGDIFTSTPLPIDQTYPSFGPLSVAYPPGKLALGDGDQATVSCVVNGASKVAYSGTELRIRLPAEYAPDKTVTNNSTGYVGSGTNYTITAVRESNGASATKTGLVVIAVTAPTASISVVPSGRLVGSPVGVDYEVRVTPSQYLLAAPSLNASLGAWQGAWTQSGGYWKRSLRISDSTPKGTGSFTSLDIVGLSGIQGSAISSGSTYEVGGFTSRNVTFPAFSRVAPIGTSVRDQTKTAAQIVGGKVLTRYTDDQTRQNGYYIANADGSYNAQGDHIALSDSAFAGSNTSGTLTATVQEAA